MTRGIFRRRGAPALRHRLIAALFVFSLIPVVLAAGTVYVVQRRAIRGQTYELLQTVVAQRAGRIRGWLRGRGEELKFLAAMPAIGQSGRRLLEGDDPPVLRERLRDQLRLARNSLPEFVEIFLLEGRRGQVVVSSDPAQEGKIKDDRPYFREGRASSFVQVIHYSLSLGRPVITMAVPVGGRGDETVGVLAGRLSMGRLDEIMGTRSGLGQTGQVFLVNRFNQQVSERADRPEPEWPMVFSPGITAVLQGQSGQTEYRNHQGREVFGVHQWLPALSLGLVGEMERREALGSLQQLTRGLVLGTVGLALVLALAAWRLGRGILKPIERLREAAEKLEEGALEHRVPALGLQEIEDVGVAFNRMATALQQAREHLEAQVHGRTAELARVNQELAVRSQQSALVLRVTRQAVGFPNMSVLLQAIAQTAAELVGCRAASIRLWTEDRQALRVAVDYGLPTALAGRGDLGPGEGVQGRVGVHGIPYEIQDMRADPAFRDRGAFLEAGLRSVLVVPLRAAQDEIFGVLTVYDGQPRSYTPAERQALQELSLVAGLALESRRLYDRVGQAYEQLKTAHLQLIHAERLATVGQLTAGVAHELNNPLTSVVGFAELARDQTQDPELKEYLSHVVRESQRAARIVRQLLRVARQEQVQEQAVSLNRVVQEILQLKAYEFGVNQISVTTELAPDVPETVGDAQLLTQVVLNLVTNAEQAMVAAHGGGHLVVRTRRVWEALELEVEDDGPGIPAELQDKVFLPFVTTKPVGQGTGLGLSVSLGIVEQHGGTITLESEEGKGARFTVRLSWRRPAEGQADGAHADEGGGAGSARESPAGRG